MAKKEFENYYRERRKHAMFIILMSQPHLYLAYIDIQSRERFNQ
ncbi:MAG: hypothetical protein R6U96_07465 [Promethearchaeia archaeon]